MKHDMILSVGYKDGEYSDGIHFHNGYELILVRRGKIEITADDRLFSAGAGTLIFISNLERHSIRVLEKPYERYYVTLDAEKCDRILADRELISLLKYRPEGFENALFLGDAAPQIEQLFVAIREEKERNDSFSETLCEGYIRQLLVFCYRLFPRAAVPENRAKEVLYAIQKHLDEHFTEEIRIKELCDAHFTNHYYLTHLFKAYTGYSPKQYLTRLRLHHAIALFTDGKQTVSEAALHAGFSNVNNFIRSFRAEFGMTPTEYKKKHISH